MKRLHHLAPFALLAFAMGAQAADPLQHQVTVVATVPTDSFYVVTPPGDNWTSDPQELAWNPLTESFGTIRKQFDVKSTIGPISASLTSLPSMVSGPNRIDLDVSVAGTALSTTGAVVVPAASAAGGTRVDFQVQAKPVTGGYQPGAYQGLVGMIFETAAP